MNRPLRIRELRGQECTELQRLLRSRKGPVNRRQRALLLWRLAEGQTVAEIQNQVQLHPNRIRYWVHRFEAEGLSGLADRARRGRPRRWSVRVREKVLRVATSRPGDLGLPFQAWSLPKLRDYLRQHGAPGISWDTVGRILAEAGWTYRQSRTWAASTDPDFERKKTP